MCPFHELSRPHIHQLNSLPDPHVCILACEARNVGSKPDPFFDTGFGLVTDTPITHSR